MAAITFGPEPIKNFDKGAMVDARDSLIKCVNRLMECSSLEVDDDTVQELLDALNDQIGNTETFDTVLVAANDNSSEVSDEA